MSGSHNDTLRMLIDPSSVHLTSTDTEDTMYRWDMLSNSSEDTTKQDDDDNDNDDNDDMETIKSIFPNYLEDEMFGGKKKLVRITMQTKLCSVLGTWVHVQHSFIDKTYNDKVYLERYDVELSDAHGMKTFYESMFLKKIIEHGKIYDLNDLDFCRNLDLHKIVIDVPFMTETTKLRMDKVRIHQSQDNKHPVYKYLSYSGILNGDIYCNLNEAYSLFMLYIETIPPFQDYIASFIVHLTKMGDVLYETEFLRIHVPYCVEINSRIGKFFAINRNYEYIGHESKNRPIVIHINRSYPDPTEDWDRVYLFDDGCSPWCESDSECNKDNMEYLEEMYDKITEKLQCLNERYIYRYTR